MLLWFLRWQRLRGHTFDQLPKGLAKQPLSAVPLLAVDLELTSLDVANAQVLSVGWVEGSGSQIDLSSCNYQIIYSASDLQQSPVIHGLTDEVVRRGDNIKTVIEMLKKYVGTHLFVLHNTQLDMSVLNRAATSLGVYIPCVVTLDTLRLAVYHLKKQHELVPPDSATLAACRRRLQLPAAPAHNALDDALATLTLWFAQQHIMDPKHQLCVKDLLHTGALQLYSLGGRVTTANQMR
ncbi:3'-5' exonuclease [Alteromonas oceanisediminis]|uniref:3'-5' exonuclease n=1 Tax=Alteromonas oceanisediminis TaxID=2836180 RepID=UPI001BDA15C3|nr:3'-5' exonuclease [Alteromonas oceanisediminis]MBT0588168.1 3'-5' exonuclease [Alteromonas oceanisediminis]